MPLPPLSIHTGGPPCPDPCGLHHPTRTLLEEDSDQQRTQQGEEKTGVLCESFFSLSTFMQERGGANFFYTFSTRRSSLIPRPHPLTWKLVWWTKSIFYTLLQQCNLATFKTFCVKPTQKNGYPSTIKREVQCNN